MGLLLPETLSESPECLCYLLVDEAEIIETGRDHTRSESVVRYNFSAKVYEEDHLQGRQGAGERPFCFFSSFLSILPLFLLAYLLVCLISLRLALDSPSSCLSITIAKGME